MTHFGIAHLTFGQTDIRATRAERAVRIFPKELIVKWCPRKQSRVAIFFALCLASGINAPAVANNQYDRLCHVAGTVITIAPALKLVLSLTTSDTRF